MLGRNTLPLEVLYQILDLLEDDWDALCACALAGKALLPCARANLYRDIPMSGNALYELQCLSRTFNEDPTLGALVRSIKISRLMAGLGSVRTSLTGKEALFAPDLLPFRCFTKLRALTLNWVDIRGVDVLVDVLAMLPTLERLVCDYLVDDGPDPSPSDLPSEARADPGPFPRLKELVVKHGHWHHTALAKRLLLDYPTAVDGLQAVDISFGSTGEALAWVPLIHAAGTRLRSLSISMADRSSRDGPYPPAMEYESDHVYVLDSIAHCSALHTLCLKYHPDPFAFGHHPQPHDLFDALCATLERSPPPFPSLTHLELWTADREGELTAVTPALCTRLARALLGPHRARYPSFARLTVRVQPQYWARLQRMWSARPDQARVERDAIVERWRAAFGEFGPGRAEGVVLNVDVLHAPRAA